MKHLIYLLLILFSLFSLFYISEPVVREVPLKTVITGLVLNPIGDTVEIFNRNQSFTTTLNHNNKFYLSIIIDSANYYSFFHGNEQTAMYIKPGDNIDLEIDTKIFDESIRYTNSDESSFLANKYMIEEQLYDDFDNYFLYLSDNEFESFSNNFKQKINPLLSNISDSIFYQKEQDSFSNTIKSYSSLRKERELLPKKGEPWIDFTYPNIDGDSISLFDFKGSLVYVDVWATWCGPCLQELPFLIQLSKDYETTDIIFLSLALQSVDDKSVWENMVNNIDCVDGIDCMVGVQLVSTNNFASKICDDYSIRLIPRFMLFDRNGNIIDIEAPRPSNVDIRVLFDQLL